VTDPDFSPFEVTFNMERADHVALCLAMQRKRRFRVFAEAVGALLIVPAAVLVATAGNFSATIEALRDVATLHAPWWIYPLILAVPALVLQQKLLVTVRARRAYHRYAIADREMRHSFETDGLETILTNFESWISWHAIEGIIETSDHLFLAISRREALILPRRAFATDADYRRLLGLVRDRGGFAN
jgi:hypothetical protein